MSVLVQRRGPIAANRRAVRLSALYLQQNGSDLSQTGTGTAAVAADVDNPTQGRIYSPGQTVTVTFTTNASAADTLDYEFCDYLDHRVSQGSFSVPAGPSSHQVTWVPSSSGYFAVKTLLRASKQFPAQVGSRPQGISTFGVLPDITGYPGFTTPTVSSPEQYRLGLVGTQDLQGTGDMYQPYYQEIGAKRVQIGRQWSQLEPNSSGQYQPITDPALVQPTAESAAGLTPYYHVDGIPSWANQSGQASAHYPPTNWTLFQAYMQKVGQEAYAIRQKLYPNMQHDYFQVTWEPDANTGTSWLGTAAEFEQLYQYAYAGLHAGDPGAIVVGPTYSMICLNIQYGTYTNGFGIGTQWLSLNGVTPYLDGLSTHGYWYGWCPPESWPAGTGLTNPPMPTTLRTLHTQMATYLKSGATKIFSTENGLPLPQVYAQNYPNLTDLQKSAAWLTRNWTIFLGEGVDLVLPFYTSDFPGTNSMGLSFNLAISTQPYGGGQISPKPAAMAAATMNRLLEGTFTLGYLNEMGAFDGTTPSVLGYAFQSRSSNQVVTALWAWGGAPKDSGDPSGPAPFNGSATYNLQVGASGTAGTVTVVDFMGNATAAAYTNGLVVLHLTEYPQYVISFDPTPILAHVTAPVGSPKAPTAATGIAGWYKADDIVGVSNGTGITTWPEASGVAAAATTPVSPTYSTGQTVAGLGVVHFDAASYTSVSLTGTPNGTAPISVYIMFRTSDAASGLFGGTTDTGGFSAQVKTGPLIEVDAEATSAICSSGSTVTANVWHRLGMTFTGTAWTMNLDGTITSGSTTATLVNDTPMLLGVCGFHYLTGDVAEIIVYSAAHSATDRDAIVGYLNRWNV